MLVWIILPAHTVVIQTENYELEFDVNLDFIWTAFEDSKGFLVINLILKQKIWRKMHHFEHYFWLQSIESPKFRSDSKSCFKFSMCCKQSFIFKNVCKMVSVSGITYQFHFQDYKALRFGKLQKSAALTMSTTFSLKRF